MARTTTRHSDGQMVYLGSRGNRPDHHTQRLPQTSSGLEHLFPGHRGRPGARAGATVDAALDGYLEISVPRPLGCARVRQASSVADSPADAASLTRNFLAPSTVLPRRSASSNDLHS